MKISERILHEAGIADRPGQYERLIKIVYEVEKLEALAKRVEDAPTAFMDTRDVLGVCAETEEGFPALYALQGKRVAIVPIEEVGE